MKKLMLVLPVLMMTAMFAVVAQAADKAAAPAKAPVAAQSKEVAAPAAATVAPAATPAPVAAVQSKDVVVTEIPMADKAAAQPVVVTRTNTAVSDDTGKVYMLKEIKVDTIKEFEPAEVEKMKMESAAEITQIEGYIAQHNKPDASEKDKKAALKGIEELISKRVDAYFVKFQTRIDVIDTVSKAAKDELKAEKKEKKAFVSSEAKAIIDGSAPAFRVPAIDQKAK